jgi:hypothetical protein
MDGGPEELIAVIQGGIMAGLRERPYVQFNFLVKLGDGNTEGPGAGFQECISLGMDMATAEYRNRHEKENNVRDLIRFDEKCRKHTVCYGSWDNIGVEKEVRSCPA